MTEKKKALSGVLNLRVDEALSREVDRIAAVDGISASEAARKLIVYGVQVQRQVEASYLELPYGLDRAATPGRIVIEAAWKAYTRRELWEQEAETEAEIDEIQAFGNR
jgi:hypothetical protein